MASFAGSDSSTKRPLENPTISHSRAGCQASLASSMTLPEALSCLSAPRFTSENERLCGRPAGQQAMPQARTASRVAVVLLPHGVTEAAAGGLEHAAPLVARRWMRSAPCACRTCYRCESPDGLPAVPERCLARAARGDKGEATRRVGEFVRLELGNSDLSRSEPDHRQRSIIGRYPSVPLPGERWVPGRTSP